MKWGAFGAGAMVAAVVAAAALAAAGAVAAKVVAGALQLLGIGLTLLGVAVVRSWLEQAAGKAVETKHGLARWWRLRQAQLRLWLSTRSLRPPKLYPVSAGASMPYETTDDLERADHTGLPEREGLAALDEDLDVLRTGLRALRRSLAAQRDELRADIRAQTRQGWELIIAGLICSAVGTVVGIAG